MGWIDLHSWIVSSTEVPDQTVRVSEHRLVRSHFLKLPRKSHLGTQYCKLSVWQQIPTNIALLRSAQYRSSIEGWTLHTFKLTQAWEHACLLLSKHKTGSIGQQTGRRRTYTILHFASPTALPLHCISAFWTHCIGAAKSTNTKRQRPATIVWACTGLAVLV